MLSAAVVSTGCAAGGGGGVHFMITQAQKAAKADAAQARKQKFASQTFEVSYRLS
jgi:hypothetical protein